MSVLALNAAEWLSIITHVKKWIGNLRRANAQRKDESKLALRTVIRAVRETTLYLRYLREGGEKAIGWERKLSLHWTELSFCLDDLGLKKLSARCSLKGRYWADPAITDRNFQKRARIRLDDIETIAQNLLKDQG